MVHTGGAILSCMQMLLGIQRPQMVSPFPLDMRSHNWLKFFKVNFSVHTEDF